MEAVDGAPHDRRDLRDAARWGLVFSELLSCAGSPSARPVHAANHSRAKYDKRLESSSSLAALGADLRSHFVNLQNRGSRHPVICISKYSRDLVAMLLGFVIPLAAYGQVSTHETYDERLRMSGAVANAGDGLFGDQVNLQDGRLSFVHQDVVLPTNSGLDVAIGRKTPSAAEGLDRTFPVFGAGWELDVPYMLGTYDTRDGWNAGGSLARCSTGSFVPALRTGPWPYYHQTPVHQHMYWHGIHINVPGSGYEQVLKLPISQPRPTDGRTYVGTTASSWKVSCLDSIRNGSGEGFSVVLPDGRTYQFDWMAKRDAVDLVDNGTYDQNGNGYDDWHKLAPLTDVFLYATKVTDRFGNQVNYTYDPSFPNRIKSIASNDGVRLDVSYNPEGRISTIKSGTRTWSYAYEKDAQGASHLRMLALPDTSKWSFSGSMPRVGGGYADSFWNNCAADPGDRTSTAPVPANSRVFKVTHPSGATGEFKYRLLYHGTNNTPGGCGSYGGINNEGGRIGSSITWGTYGVPSVYLLESLYEKNITGAALGRRSDKYMYYPSWSFSSQCGSLCATTSVTTVESEDGVSRRYTFGNNFATNAGQLLSESIEQNNKVVRKQDYTYATSAAGYPFADSKGELAVGSGIAELYGNPLAFKNRPLYRRQISQDGVSFVRHVEGYDQFVQPTRIKRESSLGFTAIDDIQYENNLSHMGSRPSPTHQQGWNRILSYGVQSTGAALENPCFRKIAADADLLS